MEQIQAFAYRSVFGQPLIFWGGLTTLTLLITTAVMGILTRFGIVVIDPRLHFAFAIMTIVAALFHGTLGILSRF
jgi:hypothetical protein